MSHSSADLNKTTDQINLVPQSSVRILRPVQVTGSSATKSTVIYVKSTVPSTTPSIQSPVLQQIAKLPKNLIIKSTNPHQLTSTIQSQSGSTYVYRTTPKIASTIRQKISHTRSDTIQSAYPKLPTLENQTNNIVTLVSTQTRPTIDRLDASNQLKTRYRNILENLLQLKNNFVQRTVTQAVQQKICNQTSDDLLNVIFKTFELILLSVDIEQISVNVSFIAFFNYQFEIINSILFEIVFFFQETYLTATAAFLTKVIETGRFMELIHSRKETKEIGKYITASMSKVLNRVSMETAYKNAREIFKQKNRNQYAQVSFISESKNEKNLPIYFVSDSGTNFKSDWLHKSIPRYPAH